MANGREISLDCIIFGLQKYGGISNYWSNIVRAVVAKPTFDSRLIVPRTNRFQSLERDWTRNAEIITERTSARFSRYLRAEGAATNGIFHTSYYRLPKDFGAKYVVTAYDFTYERYRAGPARYIHSIQKNRSLRRADLVICISESTRLDTLEFCPGIDPQKLHVIHLGVDRGTFYPDLGNSQKSPSSEVLFVGQRGGYKRFDLAVAAIRQVPFLSLGIVGPAITKDERAMLVRDLGRRWHAHGPVGTDELRRLYSSATALIFPSEYEGFGLPILEAMACGCPVVAASNSSLPEVGGSAALYAKAQCGEAFAAELRELSSEIIRDRVIGAGFCRIEKFSWENTLLKTMAIYEK